MAWLIQQRLLQKQWSCIALVANSAYRLEMQYLPDFRYPLGQEFPVRMKASFEFLLGMQ